MCCLYRGNRCKVEATEPLNPNVIIFSWYLSSKIMISRTECLCAVWNLVPVRFESPAPQSPFGSGKAPGCRSRRMRWLDSVKRWLASGLTSAGGAKQASSEVLSKHQDTGQSGGDVIHFTGHHLHCAHGVYHHHPRQRRLKFGNISR